MQDLNFSKMSGALHSFHEHISQTIEAISLKLRRTIGSHMLQSVNGLILCNDIT